MRAFPYLPLSCGTVFFIFTHFLFLPLSFTDSRGSSLRGGYCHRCSQSAPLVIPTPRPFATRTYGLYSSRFFLLRLYLGYAVIVIPGSLSRHVGQLPFWARRVVYFHFTSYLPFSVTRPFPVPLNLRSFCHSSAGANYISLTFSIFPFSPFFFPFDWSITQLPSCALYRSFYASLLCNS